MRLTCRSASLFATLFALCFSALPALAQQRDNAAQGSVVASNDVLPFAVNGAIWGTVRWQVTVAGNGAITTEWTNDPLGTGAANWLPTAYAKRLDVVTANPSTAPWVNAAPVVGTFETPIPGNCTAFRVRYQTSGTTTTLSIADGSPYVAGALAVVATLYDVTSGSNAANNTGTMEVSGWYVVEHTFTMSGGTPAFAVAEVNDAGTALASLVTGTAAFTGGLGEGVTLGGTAGLAQPTAQIILPRRVSYTSAAIVAQTSYVRILARR